MSSMGGDYTSSNSDVVVVAAGGVANSANYMTQYIYNLRTYAHSINPNFQVWVNGAEELFNPSLAGEGYTFTPTIPYASVIDGMLKEQVVYNSYGNAASTANRNFEYAMLVNCTNAGHPCILVEYVDGGNNTTTANEVADVKSWCAAHDFGYYIAASNQNLSGVDTYGWITSPTPAPPPTPTPPSPTPAPTPTPPSFTPSPNGSCLHTRSRRRGRDCW